MFEFRPKKPEPLPGIFCSPDWITKRVLLRLKSLAERRGINIIVQGGSVVKNKFGIVDYFRVEHSGNEFHVYEPDEPLKIKVPPDLSLFPCDINFDYEPQPPQFQTEGQQRALGLLHQFYQDQQLIDDLEGDLDGD